MWRLTCLPGLPSRILKPCLYGCSCRCQLCRVGFPVSWWLVASTDFSPFNNCFAASGGRDTGEARQMTGHSACPRPVSLRATLRGILVVSPGLVAVAPFRSAPTYGYVPWACSRKGISWRPLSIGPCIWCSAATSPRDLLLPNPCYTLSFSVVSSSCWPAFRPLRLSSCSSSVLPDVTADWLSRCFRSLGSAVCYIEGSIGNPNLMRIKAQHLTARF